MKKFKLDKADKGKKKPAKEKKTAGKKVVEKKKAPAKPKKEGGESKKSGTVVMLAIIVLALLVGGGAIGYTYLTGGTSGASNAPATTPMPGARPGVTPASPSGRPAPPPISAKASDDSEQDAPAAAGDASRHPAARGPVTAGTPQEKPKPALSEEETMPAPVKAIAPASKVISKPEEIPAQAAVATRHPAARGPVVASVPPPKPMLVAQNVPAIHHPSEAAPKKTAKPSSTASAKPAESQAKPEKSEKIAISTSEKKKSPTKVAATFYDVSPDTFPRETSMDDFYGWPGGQSYGTSKTMLKSGDPQAWHTTSKTETEPQFKRSETLYMVLIRESENLDELKRIASRLDLGSPKPEIKKTTSFGREVYWLTVGHYTTESKAYNKAQEVIERGYPTTIVSEVVHY